MDKTGDKEGHQGQQISNRNRRTNEKEDTDYNEESDDTTKKLCSV